MLHDILMLASLVIGGGLAAVLPISLLALLAS